MPDISEQLLEDLIARAKAASRQAYCPYSQFPVGAAVLTSNGDVFMGCNVENASFGLTICAERNAIFQMVLHGQRQIKILVIYTATETPSSPCGACRQVANEFGPQAQVICVCDGPERIDTTLDQLLPNAFGPMSLK
jgi:cytidine deaminase